MPPDRDGRVPHATLAAAALAGVDEVYRVGGAQAIAALAYGTETIRPVDVIVGPGNMYVALAKREVAGIVGIESAGRALGARRRGGRHAPDPQLVAADLVAQAEHGPDGAADPRDLGRSASPTRSTSAVGELVGRRAAPGRDRGPPRDRAAASVLVDDARRRDRRWRT